MRQLLLSVLFIALAGQVYADQLAWLSKNDANKGAETIRSYEVVYLFCGCCDEDVVTYARVSDVTVSYTGTEQYYEIILAYVDQFGEYQSEAVDLAYVWVDILGVKMTVGLLLLLDHDPCSEGDFILPVPVGAEGESWDGLYVYNTSDMSNMSYSLTVTTNNGLTSATLEVNGKDVYYKMNCLTEDLGETLNIKYLDVTNGSYWDKQNLEDLFKSQGSFPTLFKLYTNGDGEILTGWYNLSVSEEDTNKDGSILFEKIY